MAKRWYYKDENGNKVPVPQYKINSDNHYTKSDADNKFVTKESIDTKVAKTDIVQSVGNATDKIMSQKASTMAFAANTPSGDPMHNMYVAMGAVWNGSGVDKTYPTPWADYAEDEEDKVCVHKSGHWKFYDVGDLTNSEMIYAYRDCGLNIKFTDLQFIDSKSRIIALGWHKDAKSFMNDGYKPFALCTNLVEIAFYKNNTGIVNIQGNNTYIFAFSDKLKYIYGNLNFINTISNTSFIGCLDLRIVFVTNLSSNISFKDSPKLSKHCVRYMIENATDATITITLHPEAYKRAIADTGVQTALANKTNVSLTKELEYLTLSALDDGEITITIPDLVNQNYATSISYSKDKSNWTETVVDNTEQTITIPVSNGDDVYLKGVAKAWCNGDEVVSARIDSSASINASGSIMSLLYSDDFKDKTTFPEKSQYTFRELFSGNTHLINAKNLILSATNLVYNCYRSMFQNCTSLTTAPELPATALSNGCYQNMFYGCKKLTTAPELPATTLYADCYRFMFQGCTSLTTAPELPATTLYMSCYQAMFQNCTSLTTAPELPATTLSLYCYYSMFYGCSALTQAPELPATTLKKECYYRMFMNCTSLVQAPELPATTLVDRCYSSMFYGCSALTQAPELPATTLVIDCYTYMFYNCTKLSKITMLATNISATNCLDNWVNGVASTGTFTKATSMTSLPNGSSGIPTGWTVENV